jgi:phage shock protein PspC (stress-responsive transcriptional regulator)
MDETRQCPYCAETIRAEATLCRHCRSRLGSLDPEHWHRDHPERRIAGVTVGVARALALPVGAVRLAFILLTFFHFLGPALYAALWLVIPFQPGDESPLGQLIGRLHELLGTLRGTSRPGGDVRRTDPPGPDVPQGPFA